MRHTHGKQGWCKYSCVNMACCRIGCAALVVHPSMLPGITLVHLQAEKLPGGDADALRHLASVMASDVAALVLHLVYPGVSAKGGANGAAGGCGAAQLAAAFALCASARSGYTGHTWPTLCSVTRRRRWRKCRTPLPSPTSPAQRKPC